MSEIKLIQGDCIKEMKDIPDKSVDMILCDLPYGITACKWDKVIPMSDYVIIKDKKYNKKKYLEYAYKNNIAYENALKYFNKNKKMGLWTHYERVIKDNGAILLFGSQPFTSKLVCSNIDNFKYEWIWEKQKASNFMSAKYSPLKYHENILVFSYSTHNFYPQKYKVLELEEIEKMSHRELKNLFETKDYDRYGKVDKRKTINNNYELKETHLGTGLRIRSRDDGYRYPKSVIKINKSINKNIHPTQKPVELLEYLIKTYTKENETVLDNCFGSGSTGVACVNTNRNFIGIELDENYFNIAKERIEKAIKEKQNEQN